MNNKELVKDFKRAKKSLDVRDSFYGYICHVLKTKAARSVIMKRIRPCHTVRAWLLNDTDRPWDVLTKEAMYDYRQRWLDSLIEEFSEETK